MQKITISGSYKTKSGQGYEIVDFEEVTGIMPECKDEEHTFMNLKGRYAKMWIAKDNRFEKRLYHVREVYIDNIEQVEGTPSFAGKDLKTLGFEELQDLAAAKDLRGIPLWKAGSIYSAREKAYKIYRDKILRDPFDPKAEFSLAKMPSIIIDADSVAEEEQKVSNDEILDIEAKPRLLSEDKPKSNLTLEELKEMAKSKNISFHHNTGFDKLYTKVFG